MIMGRRPCCVKVGLRRGAWTIEEDIILTNFIFNHGLVCWRRLPQLAGLLRCGKSCRLRWMNYLRPGVKRGEFTEEEDDQIIQLHSRFGNKWSKIASNFPGRTDNEIKNYWNTRIRKKLKHLGLDSSTHKTVTEENKIHKKKPNQHNSINNNNNNNNNVEMEQHQHDHHLEDNKNIEPTFPNLDGDGQENELICIEYDYEMLWKSLEMVANNDHIDNNKFQDSDTSIIEQDQLKSKETFLDQELQQWLDQLETRLFSDFYDDFHEISVQNNYQHV